MYAVSPFGERRADMRAGFNTANAIAASAAKELPEGVFQTIVDHLISYLTCDKLTDGEEEELDMVALARIKERT